jgi:2-enoate reductase
VAKLVKDYFVQKSIKSNVGLPVPVAAVGKLGYPDLAERALREGLCDMVVLARPLLADPDWPRKAYAGHVKDIRPCIGDQEACLNEFIQGGHPQCAVNPRAGFEDVLCTTSIPTTTPKKVAIIGAGPAGIICACTAAQRGHQVILFEKLDKVGGKLLLSSVPKFKYDVANYLQYLRNLIEKTAQNHKLTLRLGTEVTPELVKSQSFDAMVTCTGARPLMLPTEGIDLPHVVQATDFLCNTSLGAKAQKVVVIGGDSVGCEVAYMLAYEMSKDVTIVEMLPYLMKDTCTANRGHLIHYMEKAGVRLLNCARLKSVGQSSVRIIQNVSPTVPHPYNTWSPVLPENVKNPLAKKIRSEEKQIDMEADLVVLAVGLEPDDRLYQACVRERVATEIHNIGDSSSVGHVFEATKAGYAVGNML